MEKILEMVARILFLGILIVPYAVDTHIEKKEGKERDPIKDRYEITPGTKVFVFLVILLALTFDFLAVCNNNRKIYFGLAMLLNGLIIIGIIENVVLEYEIRTGKLKTLEQYAEEEEKQKQDEEQPKRKLTKAELIDKFIAENPSISRPKAEFFNPISAAQSSNRDEENIISETLAEIYAKQGFFDKAISTYQKLILKYPEKSVNFAARIEELKKNQIK